MKELTEGILAFVVICMLLVVFAPKEFGSAIHVFISTVEGVKP